jgi:hypothetical protein
MGWTFLSMQPRLQNGCRHWDVKEDVPSNLLNNYDIINIRNFSLVLQDDDIGKVTSALVSMLSEFRYTVPFANAVLTTALSSKNQEATFNGLNRTCRHSVSRK